MIALALLLLAQDEPVKRCEVMADWVSMDVLKARIGSKKTSVGLWNISLDCQPGTRLSRERITMAIQAASENAPRFLTREEVGPILLSQRGGKWKTVQRLLLYGSMIASSALAPTIARQIGNAGAAGVSMIIPIGTELARGVDARIPDVSALGLEIPAVVEIPASGGITFTAWSSKIARPETVRASIQLLP